LSPASPSSRSSPSFQTYYTPHTPLLEPASPKLSQFDRPHLSVGVAAPEHLTFLTSLRMKYKPCSPRSLYSSLPTPPWPHHRCPQERAATS
jgi:hypothetical protein